MTAFKYLLLPFILIVLNTSSLSGADYRYSKDRSFFATFFMSEKIPVVNDPAVRSVCTGCHWTMMPGLLPARSWQRIMDGMNNHFEQKVEIQQTLKVSILEYLKENAAEFTESKVSVKILDSIHDKTPIRLSDSSFFEEQHKEIKPSQWLHKDVKFKGNCIACHKSLSATGSFDDAIIPE